MRQAVKAVAAEHYVQRLDLGMDPFDEGFHNDYFYSGAHRRQLVEQAMHFSRFSDQVVLLVGSTGSGTSTILDQLLDQLEPVMDFCSLNAESVSTPEHILNTLSDQLQLSHVNNIPEFIAELRQVESLQESAEPLLVAVDQAHFMGMEGLELLGQLYIQAAGAIHLLLVGEYQVEQLIKLSGFDSARLKVLELEPLDAEETGEYLLGVLHSVGYAGEQPLSVDQLAVLHEQSGGNIAEINLLVPKLLNAEVKEDRSFQFAMPVSHIVAVVVLLFAIGFSYWYERGQPAPDLVAVAPPDDGVVEEAQLQEVAATDTVARKSEPVDVVAALRAQEVSVREEADAVTEPNLPARQLDSEPAQNSPQDGEDNDKAHQLSTAGQSVQQGIVDRNGAGAPSGSSPGQNDTVVAPVQTLAEAESGQNERVESSPAVEQDSTVLPDSGSEAKSTEQEAEVAAAAEPSMSVRARRLLNMEPSGFMLQLMGALEEERAQKMVAAYAGRLPITYFETRRNGKPWFVVVTGPYASKAEARAGKNVLPAELQRQQPWPRSVSGVQNEIRNSRL